VSEGLRYCTFTLDGQWFGIDVRRVLEVLRPQPVTRFPTATRAVQGLVNLRGRIVTVVDLRECLGLAPRPIGREPANVVVQAGPHRACLWVDEIGEVVDVLPSDFEVAPAGRDAAGPAGIQGVYKLEDRLLPVLDVPELLRRALS
jgi:purine-binding chemotaxis protein CheW